MVTAATAKRQVRAVPKGTPVVCLHRRDNGSGVTRLRLSNGYATNVIAVADGPTARDCRAFFRINSATESAPSPHVWRERAVHVPVTVISHLPTVSGHRLC